MAMNISSSCNGTTYARAPPEWKTNTEPACSVPAFCGNNTAILQSCCGATNTITNFTADNGGQYATCTISSNSTTAFQNYQNCLLRSYASRFVCNSLETQGLSTCVGAIPNTGGPLPPIRISPGQQACTLFSTPNNTRILESCCAGENSEPVAFGSGCLSYCVATNTGDLLQCLARQLPEQTLVCRDGTVDAQSGNSTVRQNGTTGGGGQGNGAVSGLSVTSWTTALVAGLVMTMLLY